MKTTSSAFCEKLRALERGKRNTRADAMVGDLAGRCADELENAMARYARLYGFVDWVRDVSTDASLDAVREQARKTLESLK